MENKYIYKLPENPSFEQEGLKGYNYSFGLEEISVSVEDCFKGHDKYHTNKYSTKLYYVVDGSGKFSINGDIFEVTKEDLIVIPPNTEFVFAGKMRLLLIMNPAFRAQDGIDGRENDLY